MTSSNPSLLNIIIIGAGPCGLAVAARLKEPTPSAMFTDEEHQRYHWINKHRGRMSLVRAQQGRKISLKGATAQAYHFSPSPSSSPSSSTSSSVFERRVSDSSSSGSWSEYGSVGDENEDDGILVLDSSGNTWMERWNRAFRTLEIKQLRSPMFFHVDPGDRDGMLAYTAEMGREEDLWEISGCVGKELSKHRKKMKRRAKLRATTAGHIDERDRKDYFSPSTGLFADYCGSIASRYGLDMPGMIQKREVVDIRYDFHSEISPSQKIFTVKTGDGACFYSRAVVLAVGPGGQKIYPFPLTGDEVHGACHSAEIRSFPSANVKRKIQQRRETNLVIVGGGLSSAQIVDMALRKGVSRVFFLLRSDFKVKHFDLPLNWMGKFKNFEKAAFWSADTDEERLEMIKEARNGGSITPRYQKILKDHVANNRLSIHPHTSITSKTWCNITQTWRLVTEPPIPDLLARDIDYIYFATGMHMDVNELPFLQSMHNDYPIETRGGLPCLTEDLTWHTDVPLFLTGRLAALRLGPGAPNLEGARLGAERIAWAMEEMGMIGTEKGGNGLTGGQSNGSSHISSTFDRSKECFCGLGNRFSGLGVADDDPE